jgi:hypothetical protein
VARQVSEAADLIRQRELERQAREATHEAEGWAAAIEAAGDPVPQDLADSFSEAIDRAEQLWLEYSIAGQEAVEPDREMLT